tara:strand:- start:305 stop:6523 length:6219 start_codon:yes stop_codon:yes gene_type:complete
MSFRTILTFLFSGLFSHVPSLAQTKFLELGEPSWMDQTITVALDSQPFKFHKISSAVLQKASFSWHGQLSGDRSASLSFVQVKGYYHGTLIWDGVAYKFKGVGSKLQLEQAATSLPCGGCRLGSALPPDPRRSGQIARTWRTGDAKLIDLLVVYPDEVLDEAGGESALSAAVLGAVADANLCYRNSGLDLRLRLVHLVETIYDPSGVLDTDLSRINEPTDGYMDEVHGIRDHYGADLVALLTTPGGGTGGLANTMSTPSLNFADSGFSVSVWDQIGAPSYTLAHEIGHNMGCLHNREDETSEDGGQDYDLYAFSFGKRWLDGSSGYRTIMSYDDADQTYPTKIPYFSNPLVSYQGVTTGNTGTENNAEVLSITAPYVSNFRQAKIQAIEPSIMILEITEGNMSSLGVRLAMEPANTTQITVSLLGDSDFQIVGSSTLTFDANNWNLRQTVAVFAQTDADEVNGTATLSLSASGMTTVVLDLTEIEQSSSVDSSSFAFAGVVTNELGVGLAGVEVRFSDDQASVLSDTNGVFRSNLPSGWIGTATLHKDGYTLSPGSVNIYGLSGHSLEHSFTTSRSSVLYVDQDAVGQGDGTSWVNAYTDLAEALKAEADFQEVWVAEGTYLPGEVRTDTFILPPNVPVYGGFAGLETLREERNSSAYLTILSGDTGVANDYSDNVYHVVSPAEGSILDGFVLQDGYASKNLTGDDRGKGAALWADGISFTISNSIFKSNRSFQGGSSVYLKDTNATFTNCSFSNNLTEATGSGGAIYLEDSNVSFDSCSFTQNQADFYGGAIRSDSSELDLLSCTFTSNQSITSNGGGALYLNGGTFTIRSTVFTSNFSKYDGGAILTDGASGSISDSNFSANVNTSTNGGGAIHFQDGNTSLSRCRFEENLTYAQNFGGAIKFSNTQSTLSTCSFVSNRSMNNAAGAIYGDETSNLSLSDCNFTANEATQGGAIYGDGSTNLSLSDCNFTSNLGTEGGAIFLRLVVACTMSGNRFLENSARSGGALYLNDFTTFKISGNEFHENNSSEYGGAVFVTDGLLDVEGGTFYKNSSIYGGAVFVQNSNLITFDGVVGLGNEANGSSLADGGFLNQGSGSLGADFINCVFSGNRARNYGGVVLTRGNLTFTNCTLVGNESDSWGGVVVLFTGDILSLENSILWQNQATDAGNDVAVNTGTASAHYSLFDASQSYGSISGTSNLSESPAFVDADGADGIAGTLDDDLQLQANSPGIDQGSTSFTNYSTTDLLNRGRSGLPDLGAYEYWSDSPPQFTSSSSVSVSENQTSAVSLSATDPDGSALTYSITGGSDQALFEVDATSGKVLFLSAPDFEASGDANGDKVFEIQVSVSDGSGTDEQNILISLTDAAESPQIDGGNSVLELSLLEDGSVAYDLNATDPDSESSLSWALVLNPSNGTASIDAGTGVLAYLPSADYSGSDSLTVSVSDGSFTASRQVNLQVDAVNDAPVFSSGSTFSVDEGTLLVTNLTASDADGDLYQFMISGGADKDKFSLDPSTGELNFLEPPSFASPGDHDSDNQYHLVISVSDGPTSSSQGFVVTVLMVEGTLENQAPDILDGNLSLFLNILEDENLDIDLNATDTEGDTLSWTLQSGPLHGYAAIDSGTALITYSPQADYFGDDNLTVAVSDGNLSDSILLNITVTAVNDSPVIHSSDSVEIAENQTKVLEMNATDADGDPLSYSLTGGADQSKFAIDPLSGAVTFPNLHDFGNPQDANWDNQYDVVVSVSDGQASSSLSLVVTVLEVVETFENQAPDILDGQDSLSLNILEDGNLGIDLNATDSDGDSLFWTVQSGPFHGSVTIDSGTALLTYSPQADYFGDDNLTVAVSDGNLSDSILLNITVAAVNDSPVIHSSGSLEIAENQSLVFDVNATDADGDGLFYSLTGGADQAKFAIDPSSGAVTFINPADFDNPEDANGDNQYEAVLAVSDGQALSTLSFSVLILDPTEDSNSSIDTGLLGESIDLGSGWMQSSWLGSFYSEFQPWLYHSFLGWVFLSEADGNTWLYQESLGWVWTDSVAYPFLYQFVEDSGNWLYLDREVFPVRVYDYETESWTNLD